MRGLKKKIGPKAFSFARWYAAQWPTWPTTDLRTGHSRAPGRSVGLGRENAAPAWAPRRRFGLEENRPSDRIRWLRDILGGTKPASGPLPQTLAPFSFSPRAAPKASERPEQQARASGAAAGPLAGVRAHRAWARRRRVAPLRCPEMARARTSPRRPDVSSRAASTTAGNGESLPKVKASVFFLVGVRLGIG